MSERKVAYDIGGLFRVHHQAVPNRPRPYEFVQRIGVVTMLPIIFPATGQPLALVIKNERYHYGESVNLPAGNVDGGMDGPEHPLDTALRELREETGYGYPPSAKPFASVFRLRSVSNTIDYPRFFVVLRAVSRIGGQEHSDHERVTFQPIPLQDYVNPLFGLERGETYPEINAALELGSARVMDWLVAPNECTSTHIIRSFDPWLLAER